MSDTYQELSDRELEEGFWILTHRALVIRILTVFLAIVSGVTFLFTVGAVVKFIAIDRGETIKFFTELREQGGWLAPQSPVKPLEKKKLWILEGVDEMNDVVAEIVNPNELWWAEFDMYVRAGEDRHGPYPNYILPGKNRYAAALSLKLGGASSPDVEFENMRWHRVSPLERDTFLSRASFDISEPTLISGDHGGISKLVKVTRAIFTIKNKSSYRFWDVEISLLQKEGDEIVGVQLLPLSNIGPSEVRTMETRWYEEFATNPEFDIVSSVNVFDERTYQAPSLSDRPYQDVKKKDREEVGQ